MYNDQDDDGIFGTPFPALEADEIVARKPDIDQTVRDERGRRRFHGAFTGGFSAGYWNTVGSAEGFTPKIFKSSRRDKYDHTGFASKPEDFMDDEDFGSFGIAPKKIHTKDDFVENLTFGSLKDSAMTLDQAIRSVFEPSKESIGKRLFRQMKRNARLDEKAVMKIGARTEISRTPVAVSAISYEPKINRHGLGYKGMLNPDDGQTAAKNALTDGSNAIKATLKSGRRLKISGEAFGYGALEDDDAMDIYSTDDMSQYDFHLGGPVKKAPPPPVKKPFTLNQSDRIELEGFCAAKDAFSLFVDIKRKYRPVEIPRGWKRPIKKAVDQPSKKSRWDIGGKSETKSNESTTDKFSQQQKVLNANVRAVILGENLVHRTGVARKPETTAPTPEVLEFNKEIQKPMPPPPLSTSVIRTPLSGYFASKFTRSTVVADDEPLVAGLNSFSSVASKTEEKRTVESAEETTTPAKPKEPVRTVFQWHPHKLLCKRFGVQNPYPQFPDVVGIVCMNREDLSRNMMARLGTETKKLSASHKPMANIFDSLNNDNAMPTAFGSSKPEPQERIPKPRDEPTLEHEKSPAEEEEATPQPPKPAIALFKSIFASDEESGDDEDSDDDNQMGKAKPGNPVAATGGDKPTSSKTNGGGIFSGIDFDQLNKSFDPRLNTDDAASDHHGTKPTVTTAVVENKEQEDDDDDEEFGPSLPPHPPAEMNPVTNDNAVEARTKSFLQTLYQQMKMENSSKRHHHRKKKKKSSSSSGKNKKKSKHRHHNHGSKKSKLSKDKKMRRRSSSSASASSASFQSDGY